MIEDGWAFTTLVSGFTGLSVASVIFLRRPEAVQSRAAAGFVWMTSLGWMLFYGPDAFGLRMFTASFKASYTAWSLGVLSYVWLLSTLDSPLGRWLSRPLVRTVYSVAFVSLSVVMATTDAILWGYAPLRLDASFLFDVGWMGIMLVGVFVAISAWRRAPLGVLRRRNGAFALAFVVHDLSLFGFLGVAWTFSFLYSSLGWTLGPAIAGIPGIAGFLFQGLLLYGVLTTQLFDIDLKVRWGLSRGTVGAIFVAVFFAASEIATALLSPSLGVVAGILTTASLIVLLAPLRRAADSLAGWLVGGATDTAAYRRQKKEEVYQAQVEELMADATITAKERRALLRLQDTLGLEAAVAARLEREVLDRLLEPGVRDA